MTMHHGGWRYHPLDGRCFVIAAAYLDFTGSHQPGAQHQLWLASLAQRGSIAEGQALTMLQHQYGVTAARVNGAPLGRDQETSKNVQRLLVRAVRTSPCHALTRATGSARLAQSRPPCVQFRQLVLVVLTFIQAATTAPVRRDTIMSMLALTQGNIVLPAMSMASDGAPAEWGIIQDLYLALLRVATDNTYLQHARAAATSNALLARIRAMASTTTLPRCATAWSTSPAPPAQPLVQGERTSPVIALQTQTSSAPHAPMQSWASTTRPAAL